MAFPDEFPLHTPLSGESEHSSLALFRDTSAFYAWFMTTERDPLAHILVFEQLSIIMQIAKVDIEGGGFLRSGPRKKALDELHGLAEHLRDGSVQRSGITGHLKHMIDTLTDSNPKASLVVQTMLIDATQSASTHSLLTKLREKIGPDLPDFNAACLAKEMGDLFKGAPSPNAVNSKLQALIDKWI